MRVCSVGNTVGVHPSPLCSVTPIFTLSSVSGESLDLLKVFLNILPPLTNSKEQEELMQQLTEFQVPGHRRMGQGQIPSTEPPSVLGPLLCSAGH